MELYIDLINKCDLGCIFCRRKSKEKDFSSLDKIKYFLDRNLNKSVKIVKIGGMEPLAFEEIFDLVRYIKKIDESINVVICTAGMRLKNEVIIRKLAAAGVEEFEIPIYGCNAESHDYITQKKGSFRALKLALDNLKKYKKIKVRLHTVLLKGNAKNIKKILLFVNNIGYDLEKVIIYRLKKDNATKNILFMPSIDDVKHIGDIDGNIIVEGLPYCIMKNIFKNYKIPKDVMINDKDEKRYRRNVDSVKASVCKTCKFFNYCDGVAKEYLELGGFTVKPIL